MVMFAEVECTPLVPVAPTALTATVAPDGGVGSGEVRLSWDAAAYDGGTAVTDYIIEQSADGTTEWTTVDDELVSATSYTVTGLSNGTQSTSEFVR